MIDFDYISESLLPQQCEAGNAPLSVGEMAYDVVLVPDCQTLRATTVDRLESFVAAGGRLVFAGRIPELVDAKPSGRVKELAQRAECISFSKGAILSALDGVRFVDIRDDKGMRTTNLLHQVRAEGDTRYVFLCHGEKPENPDVCPREDIVLRIRGEWKVRRMDTATGEIAPLHVAYEKGRTVLRYAFYAYDSLLIELTPGRAEAGEDAPAEKKFDYYALWHPVEIALSEPNVLLLDTAQYAFDDEENWRDEEELLRADDAFREELGYPLREKEVAQPWVVPDEPITHHLRLKFTVHSEMEIKAPQLALEKAGSVEIAVNGCPVDNASVGWFVDESIKKVQLPDLPAGNSVIELTLPFGRRSNVEWCYLLGDFGVRVQGAEKTVIPPVRRLGFGDWITQGLPFYCGNVTYKIPVRVEKGTLTIRVPQYRGSVLGMEMDGVRQGDMAYAPYEYTFTNLQPGEHEVGITVYGNRVNGFGCVHNCDDSTSWFGPDCWRSEGVRWCYEYRLRKSGLLVSPQIEK